ncbi:hypothetical protein [Singulisphaera sp. PoT]|uniref:hypothetical protein n=1 Tax=Singulisphaera sp. PoT TaxID=3411797 RepID=UPI003BF57F2B
MQVTLCDKCRRQLDLLEIKPVKILDPAEFEEFTWHLCPACLDDLKAWRRSGPITPPESSAAPNPPYHPTRRFEPSMN